jgi:hypothetical protein
VRASVSIPEGPPFHPLSFRDLATHSSSTCTREGPGACAADALVETAEDTGRGARRHPRESNRLNPQLALRNVFARVESQAILDLSLDDDAAISDAQPLDAGKQS